VKSPNELSAVLARQWQNADRRESRVLGDEGAWPVVLSVGRPSAALIASDLDAVRRHLEQWRQVRVGVVEWQWVDFRSASEPVEVPVRWVLASCVEWASASNEKTVQSEHDSLASALVQVDLLFHPVLIRRRSLWRGRHVAEIVQACSAALDLEPGCADGAPLRACVVAGADTKFLERNRRLVTALLDARFDGEASYQGLEGFLGASSDAEHWLLVVDLGGNLLPYVRQRIRASELASTPLPGTRVLIVENEQCLHQLPEAADTVAVLGAGLDLAWADARWLQEKHVAYWGDIDTWGLKCLARARAAVPALRALLMIGDVFDEHFHLAVQEAVAADSTAPSDLQADEKSLYRRLLSEEKGRLEQELIPVIVVQQAVRNWVAST
jgi:hypothetical protein